MRFVAVKSEARQAAAMACRTRDLLVRQRTQTINALRAHLAEQGIVAPAGPAHVRRLAAIIDGDDGMLPAVVRDPAHLLLGQIAGLAEKIAVLDAELRRRVTTDDTARRLTTIPGAGAVTAAAITTFAPPMETFSKGRALSPQPSRPAARTQIATWKEDSNHQRPHSALGNIPPVVFAMQIRLEMMAA